MPGTSTLPYRTFRSTLFLYVLFALLIPSSMAALLPADIEGLFPACSVSPEHYTFVAVQTLICLQLNCVAAALDSEPAIAQNLKLLCAHPPIEKALADCVRGSCSFPDQQSTYASIQTESIADLLLRGWKREQRFVQRRAC